MMVGFQGLGGAGKTIFLTRLLRKKWKKGTKIFPNFDLYYDKEKTNIQRWEDIAETYNIQEGIILVDDGVRMFDARDWMSLPKNFRDKIATHRHDRVELWTTFQNLGDIDVRVRKNIHVLYTAQSLFRYPRDENVKPIFQIVVVKKQKREWVDNQNLKWSPPSFFSFYIMFISKFWTKTYYDTYTRFNQTRMLCQIELDRKSNSLLRQPIIKMTSREAIDTPKARL